MFALSLPVVLWIFWGQIPQPLEALRTSLSVSRRCVVVIVLQLFQSRSEGIDHTAVRKPRECPTCPGKHTFYAISWLRHPKGNGSLSGAGRTLHKELIHRIVASWLDILHKPMSHAFASCLSSRRAPQCDAHRRPASSLIVRVPCLVEPWGTEAGVIDVNQLWRMTLEAQPEKVDDAPSRWRRTHYVQYLRATVTNWGLYAGALDAKAGVMWRGSQEPRKDRICNRPSPVAPPICQLFGYPNNR